MPSPNSNRPHYQSAVLVGLVVLLCGLAVSCTQFKVTTIMTTIAPRFDMSASQSTWLMSIFTLVGIVFALPAGGLIQRFGFKRVMIASLSMMVCASIIGLASGTSAPILVFSRAIEGIALTFVSASAPVAIQACVRPDRRGFATGIWGCWGNGGAVIASIITPQIFEMAGFEGVWIVFAAISVVAAIVMAIAIRAPRNHSQGDEACDDNAPRASYRELLTSNCVRFLVVFVIFNIIMLALLSLLPTVLMLPEKGFSMAEAGFASTLASLLAMFSTPVMGLISDKTGKLKQLVVFTFFFLGPCLVVMYTQTGAMFWAATVVLGLFGFSCTGLLITAWMRILPRPELAPKAMGLLTLMQATGQFLGTFFVQMLLGPAFENWMLAGCVLCALGLAGTLLAATIKIPSLDAPSQ